MFLRKTLWAVAAAAVLLAASNAHAERTFRSRRSDINALRFARSMPWHGNYYHTAHGYPVPLVVPPQSNMQTSWSWGVAQTSMRPIYHQYRRPYPGDYEGGVMGQFRSTPLWPSHTDQFGVYYIRSPW